VYWNFHPEKLTRKRYKRHLNWKGKCKIINWEDKWVMKLMPSLRRIPGSSCAFFVPYNITLKSQQVAMDEGPYQIPTIPHLILDF
jgi:hypothetical protein